ncbi:DUF1254 domain-containing protein [Ruegeria atlantica]|uniref:DUF1254 domain-containing protein n=1 Tax=Ruegeria atlantica TaxID=81569 RepID=UPI001C2B9FC7|nr:DUF1254 domain-containing protein [Ruegeria atlantica]
MNATNTTILRSISYGFATLFMYSTLVVAETSNPPKLKMTTHVPPEIVTPDKVDSPIGAFEFFDGVPTQETVKLVYDNLDRMRGVDVFLNLLPAVSVYGLRIGHENVSGKGSNKVSLFKGLMDSKSLYLTANTSTLYAFAFTDLNKDGPTVIELPSGMLGALNDGFFRYVGDFGPAGPDKGKGGKYLILPPNHKGNVPEGYFVLNPKTFRNWIFLRGSVSDGLEEAVNNITSNLKIYPLSEADNPPETEFTDVSGKSYNTLPPTDFSFFEQLNQVIQEEPLGSLGPELRGQLAAIGIAKSQSFDPDERIKALLEQSAAIGNATARSIVWYPREKAAQIYPDTDSAWVMAFADRDVFFEQNGARNLDARTMFFMNYTAVTPAMAKPKPGVGSDYAIAYLDAQKKPFDGSKTYKLTLPKDVPVKDFWAVTLYDTQTRSMLQTDQQFPTRGSNSEGFVQNADGSYDIFFAPMAPSGQENNWLQTIPGKSWFAILRIYGPEQAWIDQSWRPGEIAEFEE